MFSIQELQSSTVKELFVELEKARNELIKIRINVKTKHNKDTSKVKKTKRYVAQVLTALKDADLEAKPVKKAEKVEKVEKEEKKVEDSKE